MSIEDLKIKYLNEIELVRDILTSNGVVVNETKMTLNIDNAYKVICNYLGVNEDYNMEYSTALINLAVVYYNLPEGFTRVSQMSQGSRSQTMSRTNSDVDKYGLTRQVKAMLPLPKLKVF